MNRTPRHNPVSITAQSILCQIRAICDFSISPTGRERLHVHELRQISAALNDASLRVEIEIDRQTSPSQWPHNWMGDAS
jgi:hypothetical protein